MERRDPFESTLVSSIAFGGVFLVAFAAKLVGALVARREIASSKDDALPVVLFFLGFAIVTGPVVAFARRRMRRESFRARNFVTGGLVGAIYALGCTIAFSGGMSVAAMIGLGAITCAGIWWAVASGFNEVFAERERESALQKPMRKKKRKKDAPLQR